VSAYMQVPSTLAYYSTDFMTFYMESTIKVVWRI